MVCLPHKDCDRPPQWQRFPPFVKDQSRGLNKISPRWKKSCFNFVGLVVFFRKSSAPMIEQDLARLSLVFLLFLKISGED